VSAGLGTNVEAFHLAFIPGLRRKRLRPRALFARASAPSALTRVVIPTLSLKSKIRATRVGHYLFDRIRPRVERHAAGRLVIYVCEEQAARGRSVVAGKVGQFGVKPLEA